MIDASSTVMGHGVLLLILSLLIGAPVAVEPVPYPVKWKEGPSYSVKWTAPILTDTSSFKKEALPNQEHKGLAGPPGPAYPVKWTAPVLAASDGNGGIHVEPGMLFLRRSLFPGAILPEGTRFASAVAAPAPLTRFVAPVAVDAIPFDYKQIDTILRMFQIPRGSRMADQVAATLRTCDEPSREPHTCATSQQAAAAFAAAALGTSEPRAVVTVVYGEEAAGGSARYVVAPDGIARIGGNEAVVPCHPMPYPYMVHYCHRPAGVEALRVELTSTTGGGAGATTAAMCHADTRDWDDRYFQMLNVTRGDEICHFMPRDYMLWLPAGTSV